MQNISQQIVQYLLENLPQTEADILIVKRDFCKKMDVKKIPTNAELLDELRHAEMKQYLISTKDLKYKKLFGLLKKRRIRTLSGVAPIAVLTKPYKCEGRCVYCPNEKSMPKSYLSNEPAVMRAVLCKFDPYKQVQMRLQSLDNNGHSIDKLELIVMGGTWSQLPQKYQLWYIIRCFQACNDYKKKYETQDTVYKKTTDSKIQNQYQISKTKYTDLIYAQKKNEKTGCRIIGLTLETRPDCINEDELWRMRDMGCTRIEIGVQHVDNNILKLNQRGHGVETTAKATKLMREFGFKITYHLMMNLPGSTPEKDFKMCQDIFSNPKFQPDQVKLYPCVVTQGSLLYKWWKQGKYKPYSTKTLINLLANIKSVVPEWVRIIRVIRDIPEESIVSGNKITNLRQDIQRSMQNKGLSCKCIRCREAGHQKQASINLSIGKTSNRQITKKTQSHQEKIKLKIRKYKTVSGIEYFLSFESRDEKILYAFCRLRIPNKSETVNHKPEIIHYPMIRELHTYGQMAPINKQGDIQHRGMGKKLMVEAENIVEKQGFDRLYVISGIGVREYYRKLGYRLDKTYMVKYLHKSR